MEKNIKIGKVATSPKEINDLLKAWIMISLAFAIAMSSSFDIHEFYLKFVVASLTAGIGFLLHELGHKLVAQRYGCNAEFRSFDNMLIMSLALSFLGVIFAAPGAVMISGRIDIRKNGRISAAGPLVNIALSLVFLMIVLLAKGSMIGSIAKTGLYINSLLALFNMIPFWLFDGYKILKWNKIVYGTMTASAFALMMSQNFINV